MVQLKAAFPLSRGCSVEQAIAGQLAFVLVGGPVRLRPGCRVQVDGRGYLAGLVESVGKGLEGGKMRLRDSSIRRSLRTVMGIRTDTLCPPCVSKLHQMAGFYPIDPQAT